MATESATLTALPNGIDDSGHYLKVTVFVSPRLVAGVAGGLKLLGGKFSAFQAWPDTLAGVKLAILVEGGPEYDATFDPDPPPWDATLWQGLFGASVVRDAAFNDLSERRVRSIPVREVSGTILDLYRQAAEEFPRTFPPITGPLLSGLADDLGLLGRYKDRYYGILADHFGREAEPEGTGGKRGGYLIRGPLHAGPGARMSFAEAYRFYDREDDPSDPPAPDADVTPGDVSKLDFHAAVSFCGDYPLLLRKLGLAIDVQIPNTGLKDEGRIRVRVLEAPFGWLGDEAARPWTHFQLSDRRFVPMPREKEGDLADGTLRLESERYFVINQVDVDGSTLKIVDFAANVSRVKDHLEAQGRSMTEDASSLPALRTGGFTIARDGRAARIVGQLDAAAKHESDHASKVPADLFAEDVTRGYRLDVEDGRRANGWLSLHHRIGTYTLGGPTDDPDAEPVDIDPDEGYVKGASAASVPKQSDLYVHETVVGWDGWSLASKRPGQAITDDETAEAVPADNPTKVPLYTAFEAAPGTLPRLRFGRDYRFRARVVDLAGNSVPEKLLEPRHVSDWHIFRRFDPVPSPAVVPRLPYSEGESLLRMVIRSTLGILPKDYVALDRIAGLEDHTQALRAYRDANERHLAPPISSQQLAEWHGEFDAAFGPGSAAAAIDEQYLIASKEKGSFLDPAVGRFVFNPDPNATPSALTPVEERKPLEPGEYVCHELATLDLPYLPDPLAFGPSLTTLPGETGPWTRQWPADSTAWYDRQPIRIRIEDGTGAPDYDENERLLTVYLPQAEMVTVRLASCLPDAGSLELLAVWMLQNQTIRDSRSDEAVKGLLWMLTPWVDLTLVHAVEKPLSAPTINVPPRIDRRVGETFAALDGTIGNHAKSTGRLDIDARWTEPVDDVTKDGPTEVENHGHVGNFELVPGEDDCRIGREDRPPVWWFPPMHKVRHEFGDTKHRDVIYRATATTRFREYFPPEITDDPALITHGGPEVERNILSSRRPDPPDVLYVVPTWTWQEDLFRGLRTDRWRLPPTFRRTRTGGGLRVYLGRPWYSSGAGELLGVVLEDQPWFTWALDADRGLLVSSAARARAEDVAHRALSAGMAKAAGRSSASATERMLAGLRRSPAPGSSARLSSSASRGDLIMASHAAAAEARSSRAEGPMVMFAPDEIAGLAGLAANFVLISGDPKKFVTYWGLDPIWGSAPLHDGPFIHQFPLRVAVGSDISLLEAPGHQVAVVGHKPEYDWTRKLWYCDIQIDAGPAYFPFVRMALARYQPDSIDGQHLSPVVMADFAPLVAERTAAVTRVSTSSARVTIRGPGGYTENGEQLAPWSFLSPDLEAALDLSRFAVAQVERLPAEVDTDLAWTPVGDEIHLDLSMPAGLSDIRYDGSVLIPRRNDGEQLRLALREYEILLTDESEADSHIARYRGGEGYAYTEERPVKYRLVYADYVSL